MKYLHSLLIVSLFYCDCLAQSQVDVDTVFTAPDIDSLIQRKALGTISYDQGFTTLAVEYPWSNLPDVTNYLLQDSCKVLNYSKGKRGFNEATLLYPTTFFNKIIFPSINNNNYLLSIEGDPPRTRVESIAIGLTPQSADDLWHSETLSAEETKDTLYISRILKSMSFCFKYKNCIKEESQYFAWEKEGFRLNKKPGESYNDAWKKKYREWVLNKHLKTEC